MQDVSNGKLTPEQGAAAIKAEVENKNEDKKYTKQQKVDDTRGYYQVLMKTMLDEDGYIKPGYETQYAELTSKMSEDMRLINEGKEPSWLTREEKKDGTVLATKVDPDGNTWNYTEEGGWQQQ